MIKKIKQRWKDITIMLALPMMVVNTIFDYYSGWETRIEDRKTQSRDEILKDVIYNHSHHSEDVYVTILDVDSQEVEILEHQKGEVIIPEDWKITILEEFEPDTPEERVDGYLTKIFKPIQNVSTKVIDWLKYHLWYKHQERKKIK